MKSKFLEINWSIIGKNAESWPEAGWMNFPFNVSVPKFRLGRIGGIVDPAVDFIKGSNLDYCFLNTGMAVIDKSGNCFGICSPDAPGVSLDRPGLWKYSIGFIPQKPNVFINLYNNQWSTNFTEWIEGSWSAKTFVWFGDNYESEKSLVVPSLEIRSPLRGVISHSKKGELNPIQSFVTLSEKGIAITAFEANATGEGTILRLWENTGNDKELTVNLSPEFGFNSAMPVNLVNEVQGQEIPVINHSFKIKIKGNEPVSFLLKKYVH